MPSASLRSTVSTSFPSLIQTGSPSRSEPNTSPVEHWNWFAHSLGTGGAPVTISTRSPRTSRASSGTVVASTLERGPERSKQIRHGFPVSDAARRT
jgi:hypothetical protein